MKPARAFVKKQTGFVVLMSGILLTLTHTYLIGSDADTTIHIPLALAIKEGLQIGPAASENVQILAGEIPDIQSAWVNDAPLNVSEWQQVFNQLAQTPVRNVHVLQPFTDASFAKLDPDVLGNRAFFVTFPSHQTPVAETLSTGQLLEANPLMAETAGMNVESGLLQLQGPHQSFGQSVRYGHWGPWSAYAVWPFYKTNSPGEWQNSRHILLAALPSLRVEKDQFVTPAGQFALLSQNRLPVMPLTSRELNARLSSLREFLKNPEPLLSKLSGDDVVLLQDKKLSPDAVSFRDELALNGGLASMAMTKSWLRPMPGATLLLILNIIAVLLCAFLLKPRAFFWLSLLSLGGQLLAGPIVLIEYGYLTPWSHLAVILAPAALAGASYGMVRQWTEDKVKMREFSPAFAPEDAHRLSTSFKRDVEHASEKIVTILDINVVGFAKTIENTLPDETPHQISVFLQSVIDLVHESGGFISDHSPDRILAIFGHGLSKLDRLQARDHVSRAILCAEKTQKRAIELMHDLGVGVMPPFPVRCGINSSTVRIGLIHLHDRVEFRAIGAGVDLASQLASQCEAFRILISDSSHELAKKEKTSGIEAKAISRSVRLSQSLEWCQAFEIDPFADDRETLNHATEIYRNYNNIKREENRFAFPRGAEPLLASEHGLFDVLDFSLTGLRLRSKEFIAAGSVITTWPAEFQEDNTPYRFTCTVRWGSPDQPQMSPDGVYILGVRYLDTSESELAAIANFFNNKFLDSSEGIAPHSMDDREVS